MNSRLDAPIESKEKNASVLKELSVLNKCVIGISLPPISCTGVVPRSKQLLRIMLGFTDTHGIRTLIRNVRHRMESATQE